MHCDSSVAREIIRLEGDVTSGVLQRSVPRLIFSLLTLVHKGMSKLIEFPDGTKLRGIVSLDKDQEIVQEELDDIEDLQTNRIGMRLNSTKCRVMHCGN